MAEGIEASCLCGEVRLTLVDREYRALACHCRECRKAQGGLAAVNMPVNDTDILAFEGIEQLAEYESSPGKFRAFCMRCGSPVYSRKAELPDVFRIRTGLLDERARVTVTDHIFCVDGAPWEAGTDQLPRHDTWPPES